MTIQGSRPSDQNRAPQLAPEQPSLTPAEEKHCWIVQVLKSAFSWLSETFGRLSKSLDPKRISILSTHSRWGWIGQLFRKTSPPIAQIMLDNVVKKPWPNAWTISMPSLEAFAKLGMIELSQDPAKRAQQVLNTNLCACVPLQEMVLSFTRKLNEEQKDVSFHASCCGRTEETALNESWRTYDSSQPSTAITTIHDPNAGVRITAAVSYPVDSQSVNGKEERRRIGDPAADDARFVRILTDKPNISVVVYSGADGSGHGSAPKKAAVDADKGFVSYCQNELDKQPLSLHAITKIAIGGVVEAQASILRDDEASLTVHCGVVEVQNTLGPSYAVAVITGDMKIFVLQKNGTVKELTEGNRGGIDPRDPGGQLGRLFLGSNAPDVRNLSAYVVRLSPGDTLLPMSDGVHDNLDPNELGLLPGEAFDEIMSQGTQEQKDDLKSIGKDGLTAATQEWLIRRNGVSDGTPLKNPATDRDLPVEQQGPWKNFEKLRSVYMRYKAEHIIRDRPDLSPSQALATHAIESTEGLREGLLKCERAPVSPWIYTDEKTRKQFSGKVDHISCGELLAP